MMKKFELTSETIVFEGRTLYRIRALVSFGDVMRGELGGFVEKKENLDRTGTAWVSGNAQVYGNARVYDNALVSGNAQVYGNARVYDNALVSGNARVYGNALVSGNARVYGNAQVYGNAWVYDNALVSGNARVSSDALVYGKAQVYGNAWVSSDALVYGNARVFSEARVCGARTIFWIGAVGSRNATTTFFACKDKKIRVVCGCFFGDLDAFAAKVKQTHGDNPYAKVYMLAIEMAKAQISSEVLDKLEAVEREAVEREAVSDGR